MAGDERSLREARGAHLEEQGLPADGGYDQRWVRTDIGPIPFAIPNTEGRRRTVMPHDLHHVLTGYGTDLMGEAEIGAWEIGSGTDNKTAIRLGIRVFGFMRIRERERLLHAFVRGRRSGNLYGAPVGDALLERSVADVQSELGIPDAATDPSPEELRAFRKLSLKGLAIVWGPNIPLAALAWWWLA